MGSKPSVPLTARLHNAVANNDIEKFKEVISDLRQYSANQKEAVLECKNRDGNTPLLNAITRNHYSMAKLLLGEGAYVRAVNLLETSSSGFSPLHIAVANKNQPMVELLVARGASPFLAKPQGTNPIQEAIRIGHVGILQIFMGKAHFRGCINVKVPHFMLSSGFEPHWLLVMPYEMYGSNASQNQLVWLLESKSSTCLVSSFFLRGAHYVRNGLKATLYLEPNHAKPTGICTRKDKGCFTIELEATDANPPASETFAKFLSLVLISPGNLMRHSAPPNSLLQSSPIRPHVAPTNMPALSPPPNAILGGITTSQRPAASPTQSPPSNAIPGLTSTSQRSAATPAHSPPPNFIPSRTIINQSPAATVAQSPSPNSIPSHTTTNQHPVATPAQSLPSNSIPSYLTTNQRPATQSPPAYSIPNGTTASQHAVAISLPSQPPSNSIPARTPTSQQRERSPQSRVPAAGSLPSLRSRDPFAGSEFNRRSGYLPPLETARPGESDLAFAARLATMEILDPLLAHEVPGIYEEPSVPPMPQSPATQRMNYPLQATYNTSREEETFAPSTLESPVANICQICMDLPIWFGFSHRGTMHRGICEECANNPLMQIGQKCPFCNEKIEGVLRVYDM